MGTAVTTRMTDLILPLDSSGITLASGGGKAANLVRLIRAGFNVPNGFVATTEAYDAFVAAHGLDRTIGEALHESIRTEGEVHPSDRTPPRGQGEPLDTPEALEAASSRIRSAFRAAPIPPEISEGLLSAYEALGRAPVAVRSSATAEDLPGMSFAGQQDTFLNVTGDQDLLDAVRECWSSLWTARAIGYRRRNQVPNDGVALAVVVQAMVEAEASGVLFTADPLSGHRGRIVVDATVGLGEGLVAGHVDPDHYVVDAGSLEILTEDIRRKSVRVRGTSGGGVVTEAVDVDEPAVSRAMVRELAVVGDEIDALFGFPQDVEWAVADGALYVLQSRPITSLYPLPAEDQEGPARTSSGTPGATSRVRSPEARDTSEAGELRVYLSFGAVQGLLDPLTPLGRDMLRRMIGQLAAVYMDTEVDPTRSPASASPDVGSAVPASPYPLDASGAKPARVPGDHRAQHVYAGPLVEAGQRLFIDLTPVLRHPVGRRVVQRGLHFAEPGSQSTFDALLEEPALRARGRGIRPRTAWRILVLLGRVVRMAAANLVHPDRARRRIQSHGDAIVHDYRRRAERARSDAERLGLLMDLPEAAVSGAYPYYMSAVAAGVAALNVLRALNHPLDDRGVEILTVTRGLPHNVTTEMDLALWRTAQAITVSPDARLAFEDRTPADLASAYKDQALPAAAQSAIDAFLRDYGMRGLAEIDLGRPRWRDAPAPVMAALKSYVGLDPDKAPDATFARGADSASAAVDDLVDGLRRLPLGWARARVARWAASRLRALAGLRESPKFFIVRLMGIARACLETVGATLAHADLVDSADDFAFLTLEELGRGVGDAGLVTAGGSGALAPRSWRELVAERRADFDRERRRGQVPRVLLSDGRAFYGDHATAASEEEAEEGVLLGTPVSPGVAEGTARVVADPSEANLASGDILVCRGTDPSWTPLFLAAGGLVTEVGGLMTHGSVVAREYGIPAVVGVRAATERIPDGARVRVDGSAGRVMLMDVAGATYDREAPDGDPD